MILTLLASLAATPVPNQAGARASARILSPVRVGRTGASAATLTTTRTVRDPETGAPLRVVEFQ